MLYGSLKKIKYPTGGESSFEFEANRAYVIYPNPNLEIEKPITLENCTPTYSTGTCCGEITQTQNHIFTTEHRTDGKLYCDLYDIIFFPETEYDPCYSGSSVYDIDYEIEVWRTSDNFFIGSYSFNMLGTNDPNSPYPKENHLEIEFSDLEDYGSIVAGINYEFRLTVKDGVGKFRVEVPKIENPQKVVGGLRIKKITNSDSPTSAVPVVREFAYNLANGKSSGVLSSYPTYATYIKHPIIFVLFFDSYSIVPLGDFNGYHIGYTIVEEIFPGNGKKTYEFFRETNADLNFPVGFPYEPLPPTIANGKPKKTKTYLQNGQLLAEEENVPDPGSLSFIATSFSPVRFKRLVNNTAPSSTTGAIYAGWAYNKYDVHQAFYRVQTEKKTIDGVYTETNFFYNSSLLHTQPEAISVTNSNNVTTITNHYYPHSLATGPVRDSLLSRNIIMPLETSITIGGNQVDGTRVEYSLYNSSGVPTATTASGQHIYPWKHYRYEATFDNNGYIASGAAWALKGTLDKVYSSTGLPWEFAITDWTDKEIYEWGSNGLIKKRTYKDFVWEYFYHTGTRLPSSIKNIDGQIVDYTYDKLMRLKTASARGGNVVTTYDYTYRTSMYAYNTVKSSTALTSVSGSFLTTKATAQLLDGLGRPVQDIKIQHNPTKGQDGASSSAVDVVINYEYDAQGRMHKQSLPFTSPYTNGTYYAPPGGTKYTQSTFEASPLSRTLTVTPPDWYATTTAYGTNASNEVLIPGTTSSYFAAGTLFKTTITDADNRVSITYSDKKGRLILKRQTDTGNTNPANTYYQYDNKDRVIRVMPPGVSASTTDLVFAYQYDGRDRITRKKVPDMGSVSMRYNNRDQLVFIRDSTQMGLSRSLGTKYDDYGRPLESGFVSGFPTDPNAAFSFSEILTKTWYDGYDGYTQLNLTTYPQYRGKVRRNETRLLDGANNWLYNVIDYDTHGRTTAINGNNHLNLGVSNAEAVSMTYDWADNVMAETRTHNPGSNGATGSFSINNGYRYDQAGRRIDFLTTIGGVGQHVAEYNYNHRDELIEKNLHANEISGVWSWLQSIDYSYNAQGWLTGINNWNPSATVNTPALCTPAMPNPASPARSTYNEASDLFMLDLRYDQPATGIAGLTAAPAQKAGNISQIVYRVRGREASIVSYSYDYLSRLSTSTFHNYSDAGVISGTNNYNENLTYDLRGNIQTLQRTGYYTNGSTCTYGQIDNLTYSYTANTNRLHKVLDGTTTAGDAKSRGFNGNLSTVDNSMTYDRNGNLNKNLHKNVSTITYNHLNLPTVITFTTGNTIEFLYDAAGTKLRKTVKVGATVQYVQDYLPGGIEYRQTGTGVKRVESVFHAEGRYYNTNVDASNTIAWRKEYNFKDHLGNTRLVFTDRNANGVVDITGTASTSDVLQENHYYAFGLAFEGAWLQNDAGVRDNAYTYNGKELNDDFGLNWNDYGARWYGAAIGRWNGIDPLVGKFSSWSPYNYVMGNPIVNVDPDGRDVKVNKEGNHVSISYRGAIIDESNSLSRKDVRQIRREIKSNLKSSFTGSGEGISYSIKVKLRIASSSSDLKANESSVVLADKTRPELKDSYGQAPNGFQAYVSATNRSNGEIAETATHEIGHTMGLPHNVQESKKISSTIMFGKEIPKYDFLQENTIQPRHPAAGNLMLPGNQTDACGMCVSPSQILHIFQDSNSGKLNRRDFGGGSEPFGVYPSDKPIVDVYGKILKE